MLEVYSVSNAKEFIGSKLRARLEGMFLELYSLVLHDIVPYDGVMPTDIAQTVFSLVPVGGGVIPLEKVVLTEAQVSRMATELMYVRELHLAYLSESLTSLDFLGIYTEVSDILEAEKLGVALERAAHARRLLVCMQH